jgi:fatty-acid desaturase
VWLDSSSLEILAEEAAEKRVDWIRVIPFIGVHLMCLAPIWVGWSWTAVGVAVVLYWIRMFAITGFYHRYFSHRGGHHRTAASRLGLFHLHRGAFPRHLSDQLDGPPRRHPAL